MVESSSSEDSDVRATSENPTGRIAERSAAVTVLFSAVALLFFYYLRRGWFEDIETRRFIAIGIVIVGVFALTRTYVLWRRRKVGERPTPE
jgi:hypothetical protein